MRWSHVVLCVVGSNKTKKIETKQQPAALAKMNKYKNSSQKTMKDIVYLSCLRRLFSMKWSHTQHSCSLIWMDLFNNFFLFSYTCLKRYLLVKVFTFHMYTHNYCMCVCVCCSVHIWEPHCYTEIFYIYRVWLMLISTTYYYVLLQVVISNNYR